MILEGKRVLVTGVVNRRSIAFSIAERAQAEGAEVLLTSFGRVKRMTERAAARLPTPVEVRATSLNWSFSNRKAKRELGWRTSPHEDCLEETIEWYRRYVNTVRD